MTTVVAGAHAQIGLRPCRLLTEGATVVVAPTRNPAYAAEIQATGTRAVVCDLESADIEQVAAATAAAAVVGFAAAGGAT